MKEILFLFLFFLPTFCFAQSDYKNDFTWYEALEIPPPPEADKQLGLASPFAGKSGETVIVAGGCNFPEIPVKDGGIK